MNKFFSFEQNNSGGSFDINDAKGIGPNVWIEAPDANEATERAKDIGIYFSGVEDGWDCECCGDRWSAPWSEDKGDDKPYVSDYSFSWHDTVYVHRMDGTIERIKKPA